MLDGVTLIIPCRNEAMNLEYLLREIKNIPSGVEIVLIEGGSTDETWNICEKIKNHRPSNTKIIQQSLTGKMNAVIEGVKIAKFNHIAIWDADFTVRAEDQVRIVQKYMEQDGQVLVSGSRLNRAIEFGSMRIINFVGNVFFALVLTLIFRNIIKDSLCGSKVFPAELLLNPIDSKIQRMDPFGDHSLFLESRLRGMKIEFVKIKYRKRIYGKTNIHRFKDGMKLLKMLPVLYGSYSKFVKSQRA